MTAGLHPSPSLAARADALRCGSTHPSADAKTVTRALAASPCAPSCPAGSRCQKRHARPFDTRSCRR
eukprot:2063156-Pleurochrysis_carterae.AAC.2